MPRPYPSATNPAIAAQVPTAILIFPREGGKDPQRKVIIRQHTVCAD